MKKTKKILDGTTVVKFSKQNVQMGISPLVSRLCGQTGCQKKRKTSRNSNFLVWCATFQSKLHKFRKTAQKWRFFHLFGSILDVFEDFSVLTEKQRTKPKNLSSLKFSASFDTQFAPKGARLVEIFLFEHFVLKIRQQWCPLEFFCFLQNKIWGLLYWFEA